MPISLVPKSRTHILLAVLFAMAGCEKKQDTGTEPPPGPIAVDAFPEHVSMEVDSWVNLSALVTRGGEDTRERATWTSDDPSIAVVTQEGGGDPAQVYAVAPGETWLRATFEGVVDSVSVTVSARPPQCLEGLPLLVAITNLVAACPFLTTQLYVGAINHSLKGTTILDRPQAGNWTDFDVLGFLQVQQIVLGALLTVIRSNAGFAFADGEPSDVPLIIEQPNVPETYDGPVLIVTARTKEPIPVTGDKYLEYSLAFDTDRSPDNNYHGADPFTDDWANNSDYVYKIGYYPNEDVWALQAFNLSSDLPQPVEEGTLARAVIQGGNLTWFIPWTGPQEGPLVRFTAFEHTGDFGLQGGEWDGDYHPSIDDPLMDPTAIEWDGGSGSTN